MPISSEPKSTPASIGTNLEDERISILQLKEEKDIVKLDNRHGSHLRLQELIYIDSASCDNAFGNNFCLAKVTSYHCEENRNYVCRLDEF